MKWISRTFVVSVVAWLSKIGDIFFIQPASNVHGTCKLSVSHHRIISSSPMSWLSKNLSVALLEYYAFLKLDAFNEEFRGEFLCIIGLRNCLREYKTYHSPRSFDLFNETRKHRKIAGLYVWKKMLVNTRQMREKRLLYIKLLRLSPLTV